MTLAVDRLSFRYGQRSPILDGVSLRIERGEALALLGPNGAGKTTLLRCILGLVKPSAGRVTLDGRDIHIMTRREAARLVAYVPQTSPTYFAFKVIEFVVMGRTPYLRTLGRPGPEDRAIALHELKRLGIGHLADRSMAQISGGERQIALIARALAQRAPILVLDEPTANLDYGNQLRVLEIISSAVRRGHSVLLATHAPDHGFILGGRTAMLKDARIVAAGPAVDVITSERLSALYGTPIKVVTHTEDGRNHRICIPDIGQIRAESEVSCARVSS